MLTKLSDYFCACENPKRVRNRYTHDYVIAKCGHCVACEKSRSDRYVSMINNMAEHSKGVYFVTLTFAPEYLPTAHFELSEDQTEFNVTVQHHKLQSVVVSRKPTIEKELRDFPYYEQIVQKIEHRNYTSADWHFFNIGMPSLSDSSFLGKGNFGVLDVRYPQNFLKRLRNLLSYAYPALNLKYFLVGEYGTRTFRPHFHLIIFMDYSIRQTELQNFVSLSWKYGHCDVQRVESSAANYVASYCNSSSSIPRFLQEDVCKPFCRHSNFSAYTFTANETKAVLEELYKDDSPYVIKATSNGLSVLPLQQTLRFFAYPKPSRFDSLSSYEVYDILSEYERACERQRTLNPTFKAKVAYTAIDSEFEVDKDSGIYTLSELRDLYKASSDSSKRSLDYLVDKKRYTDLYMSFRVFKIAQLLHCSSFDVIRHILRFYRGSSEHPLNFGLSLLRYQYESLELCDSIQDVAYLYSFFNDFGTEDFARNATLPECGSLEDAQKRFASVVEQTHLKTIKHKDRNSYLFYSSTHN